MLWLILKVAIAIVFSFVAAIILVLYWIDSANGNEPWHKTTDQT